MDTLKDDNERVTQLSEQIEESKQLPELERPQKDLQKERRHILVETQETPSSLRARVAETKSLRSDYEEAKNRLVEGNLRLVVPIANKFQNFSISLDDLIAEGNGGLMHAAEKYEYRRGFKFSTYATWWIRQRIRQAFTDQSKMIRQPPNMIEVRAKIRKAESDLSHELSRIPTAEEVAARARISVVKCRRLMDLRKSIASVDKIIGNREKNSFADFLQDNSVDSPFNGAAHRMLQDMLMEIMLDSLTEKERVVITSRFGLDGSNPQTLQEVAKSFQVTRERIRQIETRGIFKINCSPRVKELAEFL